MDLYEQKWPKMLAGVQRMDLYEHLCTNKGRYRRPLLRAPGGATNYSIEVFNSQIITSLLENSTETILKQFWQLVSLFCSF